MKNLGGAGVWNGCPEARKKFLDGVLGHMSASMSHGQKSQCLAADPNTEISNSTKTVVTRQDYSRVSCRETLGAGEHTNLVNSLRRFLTHSVLGDSDMHSGKRNVTVSEILFHLRETLDLMLFDYLKRGESWDELLAHVRSSVKEMQAGSLGVESDLTTMLKTLDGFLTPKCLFFFLYYSADHNLRFRLLQDFMRLYPAPLVCLNAAIPNVVVETQSSSSTLDQLLSLNVDLFQFLRVDRSADALISFSIGKKSSFEACGKTALLNRMFETQFDSTSDRRMTSGTIDVDLGEISKNNS